MEAGRCTRHGCWCTQHGCTTMLLSAISTLLPRTPAPLPTSCHDCHWIWTMSMCVQIFLGWDNIYLDAARTSVPDTRLGEAPAWGIPPPVQSILAVGVILDSSNEWKCKPEYRGSQSSKLGYFNLLLWVDLFQNKCVQSKYVIVYKCQNDVIYSRLLTSVSSKLPRMLGYKSIFFFSGIHFIWTERWIQLVMSISICLPCGWH